VDAASSRPDAFAISHGHVVDAGADLAAGTCSTNTVDAGSTRIANDVVALTLHSGSSGKMTTTVRHAVAAEPLRDGVTTDPGRAPGEPLRVLGSLS